MKKQPRDKIISLPNNHLRQRSRKVGLISEEVVKIIEDMKAATLNWEDSREHEVGVALSAVQIDKLYKLFIIRNDFDDKNNRDFAVFINPEITKLDGVITEDFEGCLSVKDIYGRVPRYEKIRIKAMNEKGQEFRMTANGFLARVLQHEVDHVNGKLFIDHIKDKPNAFFTLEPDGQLKELNYEKDIKKSSILWQ
jgi:peptide deformylase